MSQSKEVPFVSFPTALAPGSPSVSEDAGCWPVLSYSGLKVCVLGLEGHRSHLVLICPTIPEWAAVPCHPDARTPTRTCHNQQQGRASFKGGDSVQISRGEIVPGFKKHAQRASGLLIQITGSKASRKPLYWCPLAECGECWSKRPGFKRIIENHHVSLCLSLVRASEVDGARQGCLRAFSQQRAWKPPCLEETKNLTSKRWRSQANQLAVTSWVLESFASAS